MASIRRRTWKTADGKTKAAYVADYSDQHGKRHLKTFPTRKAADDWLVKTRGEVRAGTHTAEHASITVAEAAKLWLDKCDLEGLERATLRPYRNHVDLYIGPRIGGQRLARLNTPAIEAFRDGLLRDLSRPLARKVVGSLKAIIGEAQRRGLVAQNAAAPVKVDTKRREKARLAVGKDIPSKEQIQTMLGAVDDRWRPLLVTAVFTGMRSSELRGLPWDAVDLDRKVIHVRQRADQWGTIGAPKSAAGHREIPMTPMVANTLREWKLACPKGPAGLVFPNGVGNVENHSNIIQRFFEPLQVAAGAVDADGKPLYGLHALRHWFASWAIERGFSPKRLQALLGHSSIQMTFDVYGHLFPSLEDDHAKFAAGEAALVG